VIATDRISLIPPRPGSMDSTLVNFAKFRLRLPSRWTIVHSAEDGTAVDLQCDANPAGSLTISQIPAGPDKVFVGGDGARLWERPELLLRLVIAAGEIAGQFSPFDEETHRKALTWGAASFRDGGTFRRRWHIAGDSAVAAVSYECLWAERAEGLESCLPVVRSFRWTRP
jgi:hypothetical protein